MHHLWTPQQTTRHEDSLRRELGETITRALADPDITEVMLNPDGALWLDSRTRGLIPTGATMSPTRAEGLISTVAGLLGHVVSSKEPLLEAELPLDGSRLQAMLPPVVAAPAFAIRKRAIALYSLKDYLEAGTLAKAHYEALRRAVTSRSNLLISGGPGSGKTTFANALLQGMTRLAKDTERLLILESTYELQCQAPNHTILHTSGEVSLQALIRATLRMRPDRIIIGEVRGAEAHDLLKAWNTGNPGGLATLHANSATDALERLDQLVQEAGVPSQGRLIGSSVHLIVHMRREGQRRCVQKLLLVDGYDPGRGYLTRTLPET